MKVFLHVILALLGMMCSSQVAYSRVNPVFTGKITCQEDTRNSQTGGELLVLTFWNSPDFGGYLRERRVVANRGTLKSDLGKFLVCETEGEMKISCRQSQGQESSFKVFPAVENGRSVLRVEASGQLIEKNLGVKTYIRSFLQDEESLSFCEIEE